MSFQFPDAPIVGQKYDTGAMVFVWTGTVWNVEPPDVRTEIEIALDRKVSVAGDWMSGWLGAPHGDPTDPHHLTPKAYVDRWSGKVITQDTPPVDPKEDSLWYDTKGGGLYLYYDDGTSKQWIQCNGSGGASSSTSLGVAGTAAVSYGDVKLGLQYDDHLGWVMLDGRPVTDLRLGQQEKARQIGFTTNLPDARDTVPMMRLGDPLGSISGSWALTQANLPNVTLTSSGHDPAAATTSSSGAHTHTTDSQGIHNHLFEATDSITGTQHDVYGFLSRGPTTVRWKYELDIGLETSKVMIAGKLMHDGGAHTHTAQSAGAHTHTVDLPNHTHTVALGGSATPLTPKNMNCNYFVYLGEE